MIPARCTRRVPCSMTNSTYRRRKSTVSTWKKSAARIVLGLGFQERPPGLPGPGGRGSMPASLGFRQTVDGAIYGPERHHLALDAPLAPGGVFAGHLQHQITDGRCSAGPSGNAARVSPVPPDDIGVPAQQGPRGDDQPQLGSCLPGSSRASAASTARSAHDSLGLLT